MVRKSVKRRKTMKRGGYTYNKRNSGMRKRNTHSRKTQGGSDFLHLHNYHPYNMNVAPNPESTTGGRGKRRRRRKLGGSNLMGNFSNFESGKAILGAGNTFSSVATAEILTGSPPTSSNPTYQPKL